MFSVNPSTPVCVRRWRVELPWQMLGGPGSLVPHDDALGWRKTVWKPREQLSVSFYNSEDQSLSLALRSSHLLGVCDPLWLTGIASMLEGSESSAKGPDLTLILFQSYLKNERWWWKVFGKWKSSEVGNVDCGVRLPGSVKAQFFYLPAVWPWASFLASLCLNFFICKMRIK